MAAKNLGLTPVIDPTAAVRDCTLGHYTEVGARTKLAAEKGPKNLARMALRQ